jgi:glycosyltransferase involved in cell wall biosynthesis
MRVLQVCTRFPAGGIQRHVLDLSASLRRRGHHVAFAGSPGVWLNEGLDPDFHPLDLHNVAAEGGPLPRRLWRAVKAAWALRRLLARERIELIHAHESAPALVAFLATLGRKIPILVTYHGSAPDRVAEFGRIARLGADLVVTPSYRSAEDLSRRGGVPAERLAVIGLGVEPKPPVSDSEVQRLRADLLGEGGRRLVLTVARLAHQKAPDVLVEVVRRAVARDPGLRFAVVGDGPQRDDARRWAAEAGVQPYLTFVGHSDAAQHYMAAADLFLLTSRWEALPITIVEAFREGLPVVTTDAGGVAELVDAAVGAVVPIGDVEALVEQVVRIGGDEALRGRLSQAARLRSHEDRFSPGYNHALIERAYAEALGAARGGARP